MRFSPYANYRSSHIPLLGDVPSHWQVKRVKNIGRIRYGLGEPPEYVQEGVPFIRATDIKRGKIDLESVKRVNPEDIPWSRRPRLELHEILVVRSGAYTGDSAIVTSEIAGCIAGYDMVLHVENASPEFVAWTLLSKYMLEGQIHLERARAAQPHLNAEELGNFVILVPPVAEQSSIAEYLDHKILEIDQLVAQKRLLVERLREQRAALISRTVTRGLPPKAGSNAELAPPLRLKASGSEWIGEIPSHWSVTRVGYVSEKIGSGKTPRGGAESYQSDGVMLIRSQNVYDTGLRLNDAVFIDEATDEEMASTRVEPGDILLNITGASLGRCSIAPPDIPRANVNQHVCIIRTDPSRMAPSFLQKVISSGVVQSQIFSFETGSSREGLNFNQVRSLVSPLPSVPEQHAIANFLQNESSRIDHMIEKVEIAIDKLKEYRIALITAAVTGKVDVRGVNA